MMAGAGQAQQLPNLDDLSQMRGQQNGGGQIGTGLSTVPQQTLIQPVAPAVGGAELPVSRLEDILSARAGAPLRQFGYTELGVGRAVIVPQTGAVADDYILGSGDEIVATLRGQENTDLRTTVDRNGQVLLPRITPIPAAGRTLGAFRQDVDAAVRRAYVATSATVSVGRVRQISVLVSGEVNSPGQRLVTGLSSVLDALQLSGGIKKTGSLRDVRIQRHGSQFTIDLYRVLTSSGSGDSNLRLADGDRIIVSPLGRTVAVAGLVRRPGIFELPARQSSIPVAALLNLAGGQEVRGQFRFSVLRILPDGRFTMMPVTGTTGAVGDSEILFVQLGADQTINQATLAGGTALAGVRPIADGAKLSEILKEPGALGNSPYTLFGIVVRRDPRTMIRTLIPFTPVAVLNGHEEMALHSGDVIRVFSNHEITLLNFVTQSYQNTLQGFLAGLQNPLSTATSRIDGLETDADNFASAPPATQRQAILTLIDNRGPDYFDPTGTESTTALREKTGGLTAQAVPQQQQQQQQQPTGVPGMPGGYPANGAADAYASGMPMPGTMAAPPKPAEQSVAASRRAANFQATSEALENYAINREVHNFGELSRQLDLDPLILVNFLLEHRARLDGAVRGPGAYMIGPGVTLADLVQAGGGTINWADESGVELTTTAVDPVLGKSVTTRRTLALNADALSRYIVHTRDTLHFNPVFTDISVGIVSVQGQIRNPGTFAIRRGEHLSEVLMRAGGLTAVAYPYGTVFLRKSAASAERAGYLRAAQEVRDELFVAMTHVGNDKIEPGTFNALQSFVTELQNQLAVGRISVTADPSMLAARAELDPLLEPGDTIFIPQRPSTIAVLGQVMQPGNFLYRSGQSVEDYVRMAGGYSATSDSSLTFVILPDGSARRLERSWLNFDHDALPPGSSIVVPRDVTPLNSRQLILDVSQILSQFAVSIASVAVLSKQ